MAPLTYAQIREEQKRRNVEHLSSDEFSRLMNRLRGTTDFDAGIGKGLGKAVKAGSYGIDQILSPVSDLAGGFGNLLFGETGEKAFEHLPRMTLEMLPFAKAGKYATAGGAALMAGNTYEKTNDAGAAAIAGGFGLLFPAAGRAGAASVTSRSAQRLLMQGEKALVADGLKREVLQGAAAKAALAASAKDVAAGGVASALNLGTGLNQRQRMAQMLGQQLGMFGANVASQATQGAYSGGLEGAVEAFKPENLAVSALAQLPFAAAHTPRALWSSPESNAAAAYAKTEAQYGPGANNQRFNDPIHDYVLQAAQAAKRDAATLAPQVPTTITGSLPAKPPVAKFEPTTGAFKFGSQTFEPFGKITEDGPLGSISWLDKKGDTQNVAFPSRTAALSFIKNNKKQLEYYEVHNLPDQEAVVAKLRAKKTPTTEEQNQLYTPTFYEGPPPPPKPQMELDLAPAAKVVKEASLAEAPAPAPADSRSGVTETTEGAGVPKEVPQELPKTNAEIIHEAPLETKLRLVDNDDPLVALPATVTLAQHGDRIIAKAMEERQDLPLEDRVEESVAVAKEEAKETIVKKGVAESNKARAAANMENKAAWWEEAKKTLPPEVIQTYENFTKSNNERIESDRYQTDALNALYNWVNGTTKAAKKEGGTAMLGGVAGLKSVLNKVKDSASNPQRAQKPRYVTAIDPKTGKPTLKEEDAGRTKRMIFEQRERAERAVERFKNLEPDSNWTIETLPKSGRFVIRREFLQKPSMENLTDDVVDLDMAPELAPNEIGFVEREQAAKDLAAKVNEARVQISKKSVPEYVSSLHDTEEGIRDLEDLGRLNALEEGEPAYIGEREVTAAELGAARLEFALTAFSNGGSRQKFFDQLMKRKDLFPTTQEAADFLLASAEHLGKWSSNEIKLLGKNGKSGENVDLQGERMLQSQLLRNVGLADPAYLPVASKLLSLYDNQHVAWAELQNPEQSGAQGAFSVSRLGERMVWMATAGSPESTLFTLGHELNGHGLWDLYQQGKLDPLSTQRMKGFADYIKQNIENSPSDNNLILKELLSQLPAKYRNNKDLKALVEKPEGDVEEMIANVHAFMTLNAVTAPKSVMADLMHYMPKPIADMFTVMGKWGRKIMQSVAGVLYNRAKLQDTSPEAAKQLNAYVDTMKNLLHLNEAQAKYIEQATKLGLASEEGRFGQTIMSPEGLSTLQGKGLPEATQDVVKLMSLDKMRANAVKPYDKASTFWDRWLQLGPLLGQKFPEMRYTMSRAVEREAAYGKHEFDMLREYNMVRKGHHWVADPDGAITKVASDDRLATARDNIIRAINKGKYPTHMDAINAKDKDVMAELGKLSPREQTLIRENLIKFEQVQVKQSEFIREQRYEKLGHIVTTQLMAHDSSLSFKQAKAEAAQYIADLRAGTFTTTGRSDLDLLLTKSAERFEDFHQHATTNMSFVTETRYGKYKARIEFLPDPVTGKRQKSDFISAQSQAEFDMLKKQYEDGQYGPMANWIDRTKLSNSEFRMNDQVEFLMERDAEHSNDLAEALIREGIHPDRVREIVDQNSFGKELRNEMALRELAGSDKKLAKFEKRRFAGGREHLDMLQQQIMFMQTVSRALTKGTYKADFDASMASPEMRNHPERKLAQQSWDNYSRNDPAFVKATNKAAYNMFMSFHFLNMLQDGAQPLLGALPANLVNEGQGVIQAHKNVSKAMLQVGTKKGLTADEKALIEDRRKSNSGTSMYQDAGTNDVLSLIQARRMAAGLEPKTLGYWAGKTIGAPFLWGRNLHKGFTDYGADVALITAYRHYLDKGYSKQQAHESAKQLVSISMYNAGKAGRPIGIRSGDGVFGQSVAATMTQLQTYALGTLGTMKNFVDRAVGEVPGITKTERIQAGKALATQLISTVAQAGLYGLPGVAALLYGLEKGFGINARQAVANAFKDETDHDGDDLQQQIALHGLLNAVTGRDVASKSTVAGIFGLNSYDGFNASQLAGPTGQLIENMFTAAQAVGHKQYNKAWPELLPNQIKRMVKQHQNDYEFKDKNGKLLDYSSPGDNVIYGLLGLKPKDVARKQELINMQYVASEIDAEKNKQWVMDQAEKLQAGQVQEVQLAILERVKDDPTLNADALGTIIAKQYIDATTPLDPREMQGASEQLGNVMDLRYQGPSEAEKARMQQQIMQNLNFRIPVSNRSTQRTEKLSELQALRPQLSNSEALRLLNEQQRPSRKTIRNQAWLNSQP